ncbi:hypothetical protein JYU34_009631 [Plutella xylostella]|uniref:Uncharacterized protein n=1 Tax=Plutella xylostella TaxID=51655 RepID=A0ABQ7QK26_PLUXY|nr:hypothetical protein JYU34_009631 [Plutella xylostella]
MGSAPEVYLGMWRRRGRGTTTSTSAGGGGGGGGGGAPRVLHPRRHRAQSALNTRSRRSFSS